MERIFRTARDGNQVDPVDHCKYMLEKFAPKTKMDEPVRIYVGCDSQNKRYNSSFATVIAFRYGGGKGADYIYCRENVKKMKSREERLWREVETSIEVANYLKANGVQITRVDLDLNEKIAAKSHFLVKAAQGLATGYGYDSEIKPGLLIASRAADHLCRK
jgi:predicted RNase H-related nuclease YkuK (DUF458 family)